MATMRTFLREKPRTRRRSKGIRVGFVLAALTLRAATAGSNSIPLLADCSDPSSIVATIQKSDGLRIRHSLRSGQDVCYAVAVTVDGKTLEGFVNGAAHPAIEEFERD